MNDIKYKFGNLCKMDKLLESWKLQKLKQEVIENQNNHKAIKLIKFMIKIAPPSNKFPNLHSFTGEAYQTFKKEIIPLLYKILKTMVELETLPNSFKRG